MLIGMALGFVVACCRGSAAHHLALMLPFVFR